MTPEKALQLVHKYSSLQWEIRACKVYIGEALDKCTGLDGKRLERRLSFSNTYLELYSGEDGVANEKNTHLRKWYSPVMKFDGENAYLEITDLDAKECIHCYAAHMQIQKRKKLRLQFGKVKGDMTKTTPKPKVLY